MIDPEAYKTPRAKLWAAALNQYNDLKMTEGHAKLMRLALSRIVQLQESRAEDSVRISAAIEIAKTALEDTGNV